MLRIIPFAHELIKRGNTRGIAVDMTAGNGRDTLFLTTLPFEKIYSFDIQQDAIDQTKKLIKDERVTFIKDSHANVTKYVDLFDVAIFNLGYLPHGNPEIATTADTTIKAIKELFTIARTPNMIVIVVYQGHDEGKKERDAILDYVQSLPTSVMVTKYEEVNKTDAPFVIGLYTKSNWTC